MIIMGQDQPHMGGGAPAGGQLETGQGERKRHVRGSKFSFQASILAHSAAFSWSCIMRR